MNTAFGVVFLLICVGIVVLLASYKLNKSGSKSKSKEDKPTDKAPKKPNPNVGKLMPFIGLGLVLALFVGLYAGVPQFKQLVDEERVAAERRLGGRSSCEKRRSSSRRRRSRDVKTYSKVQVTETGENSWSIKMPPPGTCKGTRFDQIVLKRGDRVEVSAKGRYVWHQKGRSVGPEGNNKTPRQIAQRPEKEYNLPDSPLGSLLARIGGKNIPIGTEADFEAPADGPLIIRINDQRGYCRDQRGWLDIQIRVRREEVAKQPASSKRRTGKRRRTS